MKSFAESVVYIKTTSLSEVNKIKKELTSLISNTYPNAIFQFNNTKNAFEQIFGDEKAKYQLQISQKNKLEIPSIHQLTAIDTILNKYAKKEFSLKQTAVIHLLYENILLYKVKQEVLINTLKTAFNQHQIDYLKTAQKFIPIKLSYQEKELHTIVNNLFVKNENGKLIPVKNLIKIKNKKAYKNIFANKYGEFLPYSVFKSTTFKNLKQLSLNIYNVKITGSFIALKEMNKELFYVVIISILLLYFIMAAQFESFWQPIIILLEIPIDIGGALLLIWLFGNTINVMTIIGIVVMSGVIINDSILKIHTINQLKKEGNSILDAIKKAGKLRLKPILMTSLTTILALLPFLFITGMGAKLQKPLALVVIGGLFLGTFISLYFVPLMYYLFSKKD